MISSTKAQLLTFCFHTEYLLHFKNSDIFWLLTATAIHFYVLCIVIHVIQDVHPGYHMTFSCLSLYALYSWDSKYGFLWFWWCFAGMLFRCCRIHLCWNLSRYFFPIIRHLGFIRQVLQKQNVSPILPIEPATNILWLFGCRLLWWSRVYQISPLWSHGFPHSYYCNILGKVFTHNILEGRNYCAVTPLVWTSYAF